MNQIHPNILNLIEMNQLKELNGKLENLDESIFEVKGIISDDLAKRLFNLRLNPESLRGTVFVVFYRKHVHISYDAY